MNISSSENPNNIPTNECEHLLKSVIRLKREIITFGREPDKIEYNKILKNLDDVEQTINNHLQRFYNLIRTLEIATSTKLTEKQRLMLKWLKEKYQDPQIYTTLIERLAEDFEIPKSTVRWNLRGLRDADLINAGDKDNKGVPVSLTSSGRIIANYVVGES